MNQATLFRYFPVCSALNLCFRKFLIILTDLYFSLRKESSTQIVGLKNRKKYKYLYLIHGIDILTCW